MSSSSNNVCLMNSTYSNTKLGHRLIQDICRSLTCEYGFMRLELPPADRQRDVAEFLVFEEETQIIGQPAFRHLELYGVALAGNVHAVRYHADLKDVSYDVVKQDKMLRSFHRAWDQYLNN